MFETTVSLLVLLVIGSLVYLCCLNGKYVVKRTKLIETDIYTAFDKIRDFRSWQDWSPWIIHEPDTKLEFGENCDQEGGYYTWDGNLVGAGMLKHVKFDAPHRIDQQIEFTRPFKSVCKVSFEFQEKDNQTAVTWAMYGEMPFLFRFMTKKTADMISKDYDLGLAMLAGQLDSNAEFPRIYFDGETNLKPNYSLCKNFEGGLAAMETSMKAEFPKLVAHIEKNNGQIIGAPFTAYHQVDIKSMHFKCDMAIPVEHGLDTGDYQTKSLGSGRFYKVNLTGSYQFLELAWYSAMAHVGMLKHKYDKSRPSLEVYENDPEQVATSNEINTSLYVPIK